MWVIMVEGYCSPSEVLELASDTLCHASVHNDGEVQLLLLESIKRGFIQGDGMPNVSQPAPK